MNDGDTKRTKQEPWNTIIARTCEGYSNVDGNILCPVCMNVTPNIFTLCLHCHGRFYSCGVKNTISTNSTNTVIEIDDDEVEKGDDVEMEQPDDPDKQEQEIMDKARMDVVKTALQSQIEVEEEDEEISQEHIDNLKKKSLGSKGEGGQNIFTSSFDANEVDYDRDSQAPEIEEVMDEQDAILRSTVEFPTSSERVIEEVETEDHEAKSKSGRVHDEDYENAGPRAFDPQEHLANHELPKWCRHPEPLPFYSQDEAGCQDTGKGSSGLMDRYFIRCMGQVIKLMYTSYHQTGIARFKELIIRKRLDVMSDFTNGVFNGFDDDDMPKDPTDEQMRVFAEAKQITPDEAWHMLRGEQMIGQFALQAIAFGYTPATFKEEFGETDRPAPGTVQSMVESSKKSKQDAMSRMIKKCMNAIYNVTSYSYFRDDLINNDMHKCIDPYRSFGCLIFKASQQVG